METVVDRLLRFLPLTYADVLARSLDVDSVLDVGCGRGEVMMNVKRRINAYSVGIELYLPHLRDARRKGSHDGYILADARRLPIKSKSFEGVLCSQVVEHLERYEGLELIRRMEDIATKRVVIGTPVGYRRHGPLCGNPLQKHLSGYSSDDFRRRGYRVRGQGLRMVYGMEGWLDRYDRASPWIFYLLSYIAQFLVFFNVRFATHMICVKELRDQSMELIRSSPK